MNCFICKKKLNLIEQSIGNCRCGHIFCDKHRRVSNLKDLKDSSQNSQNLQNLQNLQNVEIGFHLCSYDYKIQQQKLVKINNPCINKTDLLKL